MSTSLNKPVKVFPDMECIILAGGLGTRLRSTVGNLPKCMAPVNGRPFLYYVFRYLEQQGCRRVILALGYRHELVVSWLGQEKWSFDIDYLIEPKPLGTGGAIRLALPEAKGTDPCVLNGDTLFLVNLNALRKAHERHQAGVTIALKEMPESDRYGLVNMNETNSIISFEEKQFRENGWISGGIYVVNKAIFLEKELPESCSFEKDYLERFVTEKRFYGEVFTDYFIDIGVPEDYFKAQGDLKELFK